MYEFVLLAVFKVHCVRSLLTTRSFFSFCEGFFRLVLNLGKLKNALH